MKPIFFIAVVLISSIVTALVTTIVVMQMTTSAPSVSLTETNPVSTEASVTTNATEEPEAPATETVADMIMGGEVVTEVVSDEPGSTEDLFTDVMQTDFIDEQHKSLELEVDKLRKEVDGYKQRGEVVPTELMVRFNAAVDTLNAYIDSFAPVSQE